MIAILTVSKDRVADYDIVQGVWMFFSKMLLDVRASSSR